MDSPNLLALTYLTHMSLCVSMALAVTGMLSVVIYRVVRDADVHTRKLLVFAHVQCADGRSYTDSCCMLYAKDIAVGNAPILSNPSPAILEQAKFFGTESNIHSLSGTAGVISPNNGDGFALIPNPHKWAVRMRDRYRFVVKVRGFAFLEKLELELSRNLKCWRFPHIGEAGSPEGAPSINGWRWIRGYFHPRTLISSMRSFGDENLVLRGLHLVSHRLPLIEGDTSVRENDDERSKPDPESSSPPKFPYCAASILALGIGVLGCGLWYLMFSEGRPGGRTVFFLANAAMPIGAILCWYGIDRLLVWSVNG
jgi:hypothetical protein